MTKVPEHVVGHTNFHAPAQIYSNFFDKKFDKKIDQKVAAVRRQLTIDEEETHLSNIVQQKNVDKFFNEMINNFLIEIEAHRKMIHLEIEEVGTQRQNDIEEILEQISPEKNIVRDFMDDIEYDSVEFVAAASKLQNKGSKNLMCLLEGYI